MPSFTYAAGSGSRVERPRSDGVGMMVIWRMALPSARIFTSAVLENLTAGLLSRSWDCRQSSASISGVVAKFSEEKCEVTPNHVARRLMKPVLLSPTGSISRKAPGSQEQREAQQTKAHLETRGSHSQHPLRTLPASLKSRINTLRAPARSCGSEVPGSVRRGCHSLIMSSHHQRLRHSRSDQHERSL